MSFSATSPAKGLSSTRHPQSRLLAKTIRKPKSEYIETDSGNIISRTSSVMGSRYIYIGGKVFIDHEVTLRGDLHRQPDDISTPSASSTGPGSGSSAPIMPIINLGRYCLLNAGCILTPPQRFSKSADKMMRYPVKIGSFVSIGKNTSVEAASIGNYVHIGDNCQIGKFAVIKDCVKVRSNTVIPPYAVIDSYSLLAGVPSRKIGRLPDCADEVLELAIRELYVGIDVDEENLLEP